MLVELAQAAETLGHAAQAVKPATAHDLTASTIVLPTSVVAAIVGAIITAPALAALGVTKWLMKQATQQRTDERAARRERDELVTKMYDELRTVSNNNGRATEVLATLATNLSGTANNLAALDKRVLSVEHTLDEGVSASLQAHSETRQVAEEILALLQRRPSRGSPGRAEAPALFLLAAASSVGLAAAEGLQQPRHVESRPDEFVATPRFASALARLAIAAPNPLSRHVQPDSH